MIGALASLVLIAGAALVVGQALVALSSRADDGRGTPPDAAAPAVGLAALLVICGIAVRLPGHAVAAAIAAGIAVVIALMLLRGRFESPPWREWLTALPGAALALLGAALPFLIAGFVGVLGAGLVNDDMASHLIIADYIADPRGPEPSFVEGGYPVGPHAIVAAVAEVTGADLVDVFAGLTLALAALAALTAHGLLRDLRPLLRILAAAMVALAYLSAAYLAQGAFKEPMIALLLLGLVAWLERTLPTGARAAVPVAVIAAGAFFAYSLPGLLWVGAVLVAAGAAWMLVGGHRPPAGWARRAAPYVAVAVVAAAVLAAIEWDRVSKFTRLEALNPDRFGSQLGNLAQSLNPFEALGIWPASEFDATATSASLPAVAFYLGAAVAVAAFVAGLFLAVRDRRYVLPAAAVAALAVWGVLAIAASPYVAAKGLAIAAPLAIAVSLRGTLGSRSLPVLLLGLALLAGGALSTFLVLRSAPVGPEAHANQLEELRAEVEGEDVLFLGRDDFIGWELRGSGEITGVVTNFYDVEDAKPRFKRGENGGEKFDVDVLFPRQLDRFRYVLATRGGPASQVPPRFEVVAQTRDYVLYERTGAVGGRRTLDEGTAIGAQLDCTDPDQRAITRGDGYAVIWDPVPAVGGEERWSPSATPVDGSPVSQRITLPNPGRWLISLEYDSRRPLRVTAPSIGLDETVAANLDFRGETPTFPVGVVETDRSLSAEFSVEPEEPNVVGRLLGAPNEAHLRSLTVTPLASNAVRRVPLIEACGKYVDWYRPG